MSRIIHIVGTGTIGEPLIGLFTDFASKLGVDEVTFNKRTPLESDKSRVRHLMDRGAKLTTAPESADAFEKMGHEVSFTSQEALERATVVIDCTPAGNQNKEKFYNDLKGPKGYLAQGSEFGFGKPYARGVNDECLVPGDDRFIQVVSCNTHNITTLIKTICHEGDDRYALERALFVCMRRANDVTQPDKFIPAPQVGTHSDAEFGTHHARDAHHLFETLDVSLDLFSSACKVNTQYMHTLFFQMHMNRDYELDEVLERLRGNRRVAMTDKKQANIIFSFGRDHGYYGRILSQTVVVTPTLSIRRGRELTGYCFTPQDGNSLLSSIAAALWLIEPDWESVSERLQPIRRWIYQEI